MDQFGYRLFYGDANKRFSPTCLLLHIDSRRRLALDNHLNYPFDYQTGTIFPSTIVPASFISTSLLRRLWFADAKDIEGHQYSAKAVFVGFCNSSATSFDDNLPREYV